LTRLTAFLAAAAAVVLVAGTAVVLWLQPSGSTAACSGGTVTGTAEIGGPFELVSETGRTVTDEEVLDAPSLVYFGYTFCPDICPLDAARNARAVDLLKEEGYDVKPVFVTIDPARDTPEVLAEFTDYMHPDMLGLTGSPDQVKWAADAYRVFYAKRGDDPATYLMDHSVFTYLVLPETGFADVFRGAPGPGGEGVTAEEVAERTLCHLRQS
jgi:protein SCO1